MTPRAADRSDRPRPPTAAEARAEVEARRAEVRAERARRFADAYCDGPLPGRWILAFSWASTLVFGAVSVAAMVDPDAAIAVFFNVAVVLFFAGCALFALDLVLIANRSRESLMGIGGLFFLAGSAPRSIQWHLLGSFGVQVAVSIVAAAVRPFTPLAFGTLVPTLGLALCGLWAVRHGVFDPRRR
jgi:hypothetical protein